MKVKLSASRIIGGVSYPKGVVSIPDKVAKNWYFLALIANREATWVQKPGQPDQSGSKSPQQKIPAMPANAIRAQAKPTESAIDDSAQSTTSKQAQQAAPVSAAPAAPKKTS